jgi:hypothetical protein
MIVRSKGLSKKECWKAKCLMTPVYLRSCLKLDNLPTCALYLTTLASLNPLIRDSHLLCVNRIKININLLTMDHRTKIVGIFKVRRDYRSTRGAIKQQLDTPLTPSRRDLLSIKACLGCREIAWMKKVKVARLTADCQLRKARRLT